jgi:short-subunit dehydrogenase
VVIFGASSGIGRATALRFAQAGDRLLLAARSDAVLTTTQRQCLDAGAAEALVAECDVAEHDDVARVIGAARAAWSAVDVVVDAAAVMAYGQLGTMPVEIFKRVVAITAFGTAHVLTEVLPVFREQRRGTVVVVNSLLGSVTVPNMGAYATAKWAQRATVRTVQQELRRDRDIHVCLVSPGAVNTPIYYQAANYFGKEVRPPWPVVEPETIAAAVLRQVDRPRRDSGPRAGALNGLIIAGFRLAPAVYDTIVTTLFNLAAVVNRAVPESPGNVTMPDAAKESVAGRWPSRG